MADYTPKPKHKFTYGLWIVGNIRRDPFGIPVQAAKSSVDKLRKDLNDQAFGSYDQDYCFGAVDVKSAFFLVKLLEENHYGVVVTSRPCLPYRRLPRS